MYSTVILYKRLGVEEDTKSGRYMAVLHIWSWVR
jgi:hypothetical protein